MRVAVTICACLATTATLAESLPTAGTLRAFEAHLRAAPAFRASTPAVEWHASARSPLQRALPGMTVFAGSSFASVDEVVDVGRSRSYEQAAISAGVRIPLLGSRTRQIDELDDATLADLVRESDSELQRRQQLALVRQAYFDYWSARERGELASAYLADRPALESILTRRTAAGLLFESDRLEFMASFANAAAELARATADARTASLTLTRLTQAQPATQVTPIVASDESCVSFDVDAHPEIRALAARAAQLEKRSESARWRSIQSELRVGVTRSEEMASGAPGQSAFVSMSFDYAFGAADARARTERIERESVAQRLASRRQQLSLEIEQLSATRSVLAQSASLASATRAAAEAKYRERSLRAAKLAGDVIEQRQQSRYALYRAKLAEHAAAREQFAWHIAAAAFEDSSCRGQALVAEPVMTVSLDRDDARGIYVWSPAQLLTALREPAATSVWQRLDTLKIRRLLLSFDRRELAHWRRNPRPLIAAIEALHARGYSVEWLLGEPTWILPSSRIELLALLDTFSGLHFDAIHLDLEPNQLDAAGGDGRQYLGDLLQTLRLVRSRTTGRIGLSIHPRYMTLPVGELPFAEQLASLQIEPTLMIYLSDANRVVEIASELTRRWPALPRRIAVSLEHELDDHHSVEHLSAQALEEHLADLERRLSASGFRGLVLQPSTQWLYSSTDVTRLP